MIYFLDCDLSGADSVQHLIDAGKVKRITIPSWTRFINTMNELLTVVTPNDLVIIDTVTKVAETLRENVLRGESPDSSLSAVHEVMKGERYGQNSYLIAQQWFMRMVQNLYRGGEGCRIITTAHEDLKAIDPYNQTVTKKGPLLNDKFAASLIASSTDVFRLYWTPVPILNEKGEVQFKEYTRFLQLKDSDDAIAKHHVSPKVSVGLPKAMSEPTLPKLYKRLGKKPSWLTIYGPPGIGKTTLACSEAEEEPKEKQ